MKVQASSDKNVIFEPSELVLDKNGAVYHLGLLPEQLADSVIVVGDPARVKKISERFDAIEHRIENREFVTHTGRIGNKRISALSTGIGTDNIDIVVNELDALRNIDLATRKAYAKTNPLIIVRIGTCGAMNKDIPVLDFVHSRYAIGLDAVMHYYQCEYDKDEMELVIEFVQYTQWPLNGIMPYAIKGSDSLGALFQEGFFQGITLTACGFYGPQGRQLRLPIAMKGFNGSVSSFAFRQLPIANYEMESSSLFGLGAALGHECTTVCTVIANRLRNEFADNYHPAIDKLIDTVLARLTAD